ncbi:hypothetical protein Efla_004692 [Eimeria flavescens]
MAKEKSASTCSAGPLCCLPLAAAGQDTQESACMQKESGFMRSKRAPLLLRDRCLLPACGAPAAVTALACNPASSSVCVATADRLLRLMGGGKDKDKPTHRITGLAFNHDGSQVAAAQDDGVTHVYVVGRDQPRRICCRLPLGSPATCLTWAREGSRLLFVGLLSGKVRVADVLANKLGALHEAHSQVTSLACTPDGCLIASGHNNGQLLLHSIRPETPPPALRTVARLGGPVVSLQLQEETIACSAEHKVLLLSLDGTKLKQLDGLEQPALLAAHPAAPWVAAASGQAVLLLCTRPRPPAAADADAADGQQQVAWQPAASLLHPRMQSLSAVCWTANGGAVCVATADGSVEELLAVESIITAEELDACTTLEGVLLVRRMHADCWLPLVRMQEPIKALAVQRPLLRADSRERLVFAEAEKGIVCFLLPSKRSFSLPGGEKQKNIKWIDQRERLCLFHMANGDGTRGGHISLITGEEGEIIKLQTTSPASADFISLLASQVRYFSVLLFLLLFPAGRITRIPTGEHVAHIQSERAVRWFGLTERFLLVLDAEGHLRRLSVKAEEQQKEDCLLLTDCSKALLLSSESLLVAQQNHNVCIWYNIDSAELVDVLLTDGLLHRVAVKVKTKNEEEAEEEEEKEAEGEGGGGEGEVFVVLRGPYQAEKKHPLCSVRRSFERCLRSHRFKEASDLLSRLPEGRTTSDLWRRLSSCALSDCQFDSLLCSEEQEENEQPADCMHRVAVAAWAAAAAGDLADARFLRKLLQSRGFFGSCAYNGHAMSTTHFLAGLAVFKKNFSAADYLLLQKGEVDAVVQMHRQLFRWKHCVRVLEEYSHKQAEEVRGEYTAWLLDHCRFEEAGGLLLEKGQLIEGVSLLLRGRVPARAAAAVCRSLPPVALHAAAPLKAEAQDAAAAEAAAAAFPAELAAAVADELLQIHLNQQAAQLLAHVGLWKPAMQLYLRCKEFKKAAEIAGVIAPEELPQLYEKMGRVRLQEGDTEAAIAHFLKAGCELQALDACMQAGLWRRAARLLQQQLQQQTDPEAAKQLLLVASKLEEQGDLSEAEDAYVNAVERAVNMRLERGQTQAAFQLARRAPGSEALRLFMQQRAQQMAAEGNLQDAEGALLSVGDVHGALQLLLSLRQFDRLLLLLDSTRQVSRNAVCMRLATRLAAEGSHADAERLFLACGEWKAAADMYAAAGDWAAAARVADSSNCSDARSRIWRRRAQQLLRLQGPEAAVQLLIERGEAAAAVQLALESSAFALAEQTAERHCPDRVAAVYLQLARHSEAAGETAAAEAAFLKAGAPAAALNMYTSRGKWEEAIRVAREHRQSEVQPLLMQQAKARVAAEDIEGAQEALLEAGRSDLAVQLLVRKGRWAAAIRLCSSKAPHLLHELLQQQQQQQAAVKTPQELRELCDALEAAKAFKRAISLCLQADHVQTADPMELRDFWLHAVALARRLDEPAVHAAAAAAAAQKLQQAGDCAAAGQVLVEAGKGEEALQARTLTDGDLARSLGAAAEQQLARHRRMHLKGRKDVEGLLQCGDTETALSLLAEAGEWSRCLDTAADKAPALLPLFLTRHLLQTQQAAAAAAAAEAVGKYGGQAAAAEDLALLCERVAAALRAQHLQRQISKGNLLLPDRHEEETAAGHSDLELHADCGSNTIGRVKTMYMGLFDSEQQHPSLSALLHWFSRWSGQQRRRAEALLLQGHFESVILACGHRQGLEEVAAKAAISVLRYSRDSPNLDWLYHRAGLKCRRAGWPSLSFWLLNRYLDLCEFIEDREQTELDVQPFKSAGLPLPPLSELPKEHSLPPLQQEQTRDLVLWWSVDSAVKAAFPTSSPAAASDLAAFIRQLCCCPWCTARVEGSSVAAAAAAEEEDTAFFPFPSVACAAAASAAIAVVAAAVVADASYAATALVAAAVVAAAAVAVAAAAAVSTVVAAASDARAVAAAAAVPAAAAAAAAAKAAAAAAGGLWR